MKNKHYGSLLLLLLCPMLFAPVEADETEIYFADKSSEVKPNILFLIDASGSMKQTVTTDTQVPQRSRMQILKDSFSEVMSTAPPNLNVGLMHYANHGLGNDYWWSSLKGVNFPATPIDAKVESLIAPYKASDNLPNPATGDTTVREFLASVVNNWSANGYTPIVDSLYEASRYYRGDFVGWGRDVPSLGWAAHPLTYDTGLSCSASHDEDCVKSWDQCNSNIVPGSCNSIDYNVCANWITTGSDGSGYCENNDYSKIESIETCKHTICDAVNGTPKYKSPIAYKCQANFVVLMSDGKPEYPYYPGLGDVDGTKYYPPSVRDPAATEIGGVAHTSQIKITTKLQDYMGAAAANNCGTTAAAPNGYDSGRCGAELTHWLASTDQNTSLTGNQVVDTYAVGFAMADEPKGAAYLQSLVTKEDGFFAAENADELSGAFSAILSSISKEVSSFSSPTYTVDENTLLANSDEIYIPMFSRDSKPLWSGNLKKFKRQQYTLSDGTVGSKIVDKNGMEAVNEKGEFTNTAYDFWGATASGQNVATGGVASQLPAPAARKLYTDVGTSDLTSPTNTLSSENALITTTMLAGTYTTTNSLQDYWGGESDGISCAGSYKDCNGGSHYVLGNPLTNAGCVNIKQVTTCPIVGSSITTEQRTQLLDFVRGVGLDGQPRQHMGDMLNAKPMVVDYGTQKRIFAATNEGFLHSIDTETGVEKWAFMPNSLLDNINTFYKNTPSEAHVYGIDGSLTIWNYDKNFDGKINAADNDKRVMFFGLRRGGNSYYAIDITSPDNPVILWKKENSLGIDDGTWNVLGETWSKPTLAKMRIGSPSSNELRDVLVFGAGYDAAKDTEVARTADKLGRDVMIVDALTGQLHWSLQRDVLNGFSGSDFDNPIPSNTNRLKDSVPGDIRVLDMDRNGALDRLYFADTGGNLWRVDMDHDVRDADTTSLYNYKDAILTKIAALGTDGNNGTDTRKFFYEPDVALIQHNGQVLMTIALGSGYRTHPLNTKTNDRFYVLMDPNVYKEPPTDFAAITNADLIDAHAAIGATGGFAGTDDSLLTTEHKGWYYTFSNTGEKVLAPAVTFLNKVVFTTFAPVDESGVGATGDPCDKPPNSARAYVLDLFTGRAVANLDRSADSSKDDYVVAGTNEILSAAQIVFRIPTADDGTACKAGDCQQTVEIRVGKMNLPLMDDSNSDNANTGNSESDIAGKTDLSDILPRMFWRDHDVSGGN